MESNRFVFGVLFVLSIHAVGRVAVTRRYSILFQPVLLKRVPYYMTFKLQTEFRLIY